MGRKKCPQVTTVEKEKCMTPECLATDLEIPDPQCPVTTWSDWSPCSVTCGSGVKIRTRLLLVEPAAREMCNGRLQLNQQRVCSVPTPCQFNANEAQEICILAPETGPCRGSYPRFAYNNQENRCTEFNYGGCRGNRNNFLTNDQCMDTCGAIRQQPSINAIPIANQPEDCVMTEWTRWSPCSVTCGRGRATAQRSITKQPRYGGTPCGKVIKQKQCIQLDC